MDGGAGRKRASHEKRQLNPVPRKKGKFLCGAQKTKEKMESMTVAQQSGGSADR